MSLLRTVLLLLLPAVLATDGRFDKLERFAGSCPELNPTPGFKLRHYMKKWFVYQEYPSSGLKCSTETYSKADKGKFKIIKSSVRVSDGEATEVEEVALPVTEHGKKKPGRFMISTQGVGGTDENYIVLYADQQISIVWHCINLSDLYDGKQDGNLQALLILTTIDPVAENQQEALKSAVKKMERKLKKFGLDKNSAKLNTIDHNNCLA